MNLIKLTAFLTMIISFLIYAASCWAANYSNPIDGVFRNIYGDSITVGVPSMVSKSPAYND